MIVGLTGLRGSGKDTAAKVLYEQGFAHLKMAGPLKGMLDGLLLSQGVDRPTRQRMLEGDLKELPTPFLSGRSPRYAMQTLGTEWGRDLMAGNFWVETFERSCTQYRDVVCSDIRFPNEVDACDVVYRIDRGGAADVHPSEALIPTLKVDAVIYNNSTVWALQDHLLGLVAAWSPPTNE